MNHNAGIQFFGIDNVLQAYENNKCPAFSLWSGKLMLLKYDGTGPDGNVAPSISEGTQLLNDYLNAMYEGTTAIYTLRTYEDHKTGQKIKPSTEYDTAFNFKINVQQGGTMGAAVYSKAGNTAVLEELRKINLRLDAVEDGDDDDDEEPTIIGTINDLIKEPERLREVVDSIGTLGNVVKNLLGFSVPASASLGNVQRVSDISSDTSSPQERLQRLGNAIDRLEKVDPKIVEHLEKLARIAENNPGKFKGLISMLEIM